MTETSRIESINELHNTVTSSAILITAKLFNNDPDSECAKLFRDIVLRQIQNKDYIGADSGLVYFYTKFILLEPNFRYKVGSLISYLQMGVKVLTQA